jgi:hypothetical protein
MPLTIEEAFGLARRVSHHRHGEVEQYKDIVVPPQRLSTDSERLLAEMLRDEGFGE